MKILEVLTSRRILGNYGERAAAKYLRKHKYKILETNFVAENAEIDIIAKDGETTVFVEVKTRSFSEPTPTTYRAASAVTKEKQRKIIECAKVYLAHHYGSGRVRFDVIEVYTEGKAPRFKVKEINHITAAFDKTTAYSR